jgi:hypothetical protein
MAWLALWGNGVSGSADNDQAPALQQPESAASGNDMVVAESGD